MVLTPWLEPDFVFLGVKKRLNRLGVIGGGLFSLRLATAGRGAGGDDMDVSASSTVNKTFSMAWIPFVVLFPECGPESLYGEWRREKWRGLMKEDGA